MTDFTDRVYHIDIGEKSFVEIAEKFGIDARGVTQLLITMQDEDYDNHATLRWTEVVRDETGHIITPVVKENYVAVLNVRRSL